MEDEVGNTSIRKESFRRTNQFSDGGGMRDGVVAEEA